MPSITFRLARSFGNYKIKSMPLRKLLPDERLPSVRHLDLHALERRGIEGIVYDLDNTLGAWGFTHFAEETLRHLEAVKKRGFQLGFLSNDHGEGRHHVKESLSAHPLLFNAKKPRRAGYRAILEHFKLLPHQAAMVGDQIFTDILGAKRVGMYAIMVDPVAPEIEEPQVRLRRFLERQILRFKA